MAAPLVNQLWRVSETYPDPTIDAKGQPTDPGTGGGWIPTSTLREEWGTLRVVFDGEDVTYLRDVVTQVESWGSAEPLGDTRAVIRFPQITPYDALGSGDLVSIAPWVDVEIKRLHPDGTTLSTLWEGMASAFDESLDGGLTVVCLGALHQIGLYVRAPGISDEPVDIGNLIANEFANANRPALRTQDMAVVATSITSRVKGAWEPPSEYVARLLDSAYNGSGQQYTVDHDRPRLPVLRLKDTSTEDWTVHVGQPGVVHDLSIDYRESPNVVYTEGTDQSGAPHRGMFVDQALGAPLFQPAAYDNDVHGWDEDGLGDLDDNSVRVDDTAIRIESLLTVGETFSRAEAKDLAGKQMALRVPSWLGDVTLQADPQEGSRLEMRAGDNIRLRSLRGTAAGILTHIAEVEVRRDGDSYSVSCSTDTQARDAALINMIKARNDEAAKNPVSRLLAGHDSGAVKDSQVPWDTGAGSGVIPNDATNGHRHITGTSTIACPADDWEVVRILASQKDTIVHTIFETSPAVAFHVSIYERFIATGDLPSNPFADGAWDDKPDGYIIGWGQFNQAAGYYPGTESDGSAITGILQWEETWQYHHDDTDDREALPYLWVAIWCKDAADVWGRLTRGIGYGE